MLIFKPPYGERISAKDMFALYEMIWTKLNHDYSGTDAWIITNQNEASEKIGLRPSEKYPLMNGAIECEFRKYELFKGKRNDFVKVREENKSKIRKPRFN